MKITQADKNLKSQIKRLDQQKRNLITVKEQEIGNLKKFYNNKTKETQLDGVEKTLEAKDRSDKQLLEVMQREENRLNDYRKKMKNAQNLLEENKSQLLKARQAHVQDIHNQIQEVVAEEHAKGQEYIRDIGRKNQNYIQHLDRETSQKQVALRSQARAKINTEARQNELKLKLQEDKIRKQRQQRDLDFAKAIAAEKMEHNRYLKKLYSKNHIQKLHQKKVSDQLLSENQAFHNRQLKQEEEIFQNRMAALINEHTALYKRVKARLEKEIESTKEHYTKFKQNIVSKADDNFYAISKLKPFVTDLGNEYVVAIETPVHEKENYIFSAHQRNLKLSLNRRFDQRIETPEGGFHKSRRSEISTQEFKVNDIVDPSTITRKYEDGILMFKIAKL